MPHTQPQQPSKVFTGTVDEVFSHRHEIPPDARLELKVFEAATSHADPSAPAATRTRPSALGKYAFVGGGSEQFAREKQADIEREDRQR